MENQLEISLEEQKLLSEEYSRQEERRKIALAGHPQFIETATLEESYGEVDLSPLLRKAG